MEKTPLLLVILSDLSNFLVPQLREQTQYVNEASSITTHFENLSLNSL